MLGSDYLRPLPTPTGVGFFNLIGKTSVYFVADVGVVLGSPNHSMAGYRPLPSWKTKPKDAPLLRYSDIYLDVGGSFGLPLKGALVSRI